MRIHSFCLKFDALLAFCSTHSISESIRRSLGRLGPINSAGGELLRVIRTKPPGPGCMSHSLSVACGPRTARGPQLLPSDVACRISPAVNIRRGYLNDGTFDVLSRMAVPPHFTTRNLSGRFVLNETLSAGADSVLEQQGVSAPELRRTTLRGVLSFNHYTSDDGEERIWLAQAIDGHSKLVDEERALDWRERKRDDPLLGPLTSKIRRVKTHKLEPRFLRAGWTPDTLKYGVLHSHTSGRAWVAVETWGIEEVAGERRFARHVEFSGPGGRNIEAHLVYDYVEGLS
ncbi:hypothetical protein B0H17DRAFT_1099839 [Mycena rosella]|uniref:Uncharacterized protein n=1 Tax=Mycena rosella TaxID=1033263 RepID=A0AAD7CN86_MYCRO|nr:hypothetical protein B0H17DRAFT_1099839 [Mycena rosella]